MTRALSLGFSMLTKYWFKYAEDTPCPMTIKSSQQMLQAEMSIESSLLQSLHNEP